MSTPQKLENHLVWFRQDLRVHDHTAFWHAMQLESDQSCYALVILSPKQWQQHDDAPAKIDFYLRQLEQLKQSLLACGVPLIVEIIPLWKDIPKKLAKLAKKYQVKQVFAHVESGVNEQQRDQVTQENLNASDINFSLLQDRTLFPLGSIRNKSDQPYQVFGAFKKACYARLSISLPKLYAKPKAQKHCPDIGESSSIPTLKQLGVAEVSSDIQKMWVVGEKHAQKRLDHFIEHELADYGTARDIPSVVGTSQLSPYLNTGILSIRQCIQAIFQKQQHDFIIEQAGQQIWLDELLWREFYQHLLYDHPKLSKHQPFKEKTRKLDWRKSESDFKAWTQGLTGVPIVDAGMRQLLATGWMHNRVRMICAMFLSKNLLIDWRKGEQWFMQHLIDGDLAANNGGWQWCASTGTDSVPYFRIFNPVSQSLKFDADAKYIKHWLPELKKLDARQAHEPYAKQPDLKLNYPKPIVDLKQSRKQAIEAFSSLG